MPGDSGRAAQGVLCGQGMEVLPLELSECGVSPCPPRVWPRHSQRAGRVITNLSRLTTTCFTGDYRGRVLDWSSSGGRWRQEQVSTCWGLSQFLSSRATLLRGRRLRKDLSATSENGVMCEDGCLTQDQPHNLQGPLQDESAGPLAGTLLGISGWSQQNLPPGVGPSKHRRHGNARSCAMSQPWSKSSLQDFRRILLTGNSAAYTGRGGGSSALLLYACTCWRQDRVGPQPCVLSPSLGDVHFAPLTLSWQPSSSASVREPRLAPVPDGQLLLRVCYF